jgi:hypothetical protein
LLFGYIAFPQANTISGSKKLEEVPEFLPEGDLWQPIMKFPK